MNTPVKKFQAGVVSVSVWENQTNNGERTFNTVSLQRNFKDTQDKWQSSNSLRKNDLPNAIIALQEAFKYLSLKESN